MSYKIPIAITVALCLYSNPPAIAGQVTQIAKNFDCIKTIIPGKATRSGIATGVLSKHVTIRLCNNKTRSVYFKNGQLKSSAFKARTNKKPSWAAKGNVLPDGIVTTGTKGIRQAWLSQPNRRYDHAILGDNIEAGGFVIKLANRRKLEYTLGPDAVFEDRLVRVVDLNNDGKNEIIAIRTDLIRGSSLAIYAIRGPKIVQIARSKEIGRSHRWLNPVAAADFDGDGKVELAWVETPHIGGTLKIARLKGTGPTGQLKTIDSLAGFSNHTIGSRELMQSVTFDWNGDGLKDLILPGARRQTLRVVSFVKGKLKIIDIMKIPGTIASPLIAADLNRDSKGEALLVTKDNRLFSFSP